MPISTLSKAIAAAMLPLLLASGVAAQQPWERPERYDLPPAQPDPSRAPPPYQPDAYPPAASPDRRGGRAARPNDAYVPPPSSQSAWGTPPSGPPDRYPPSSQPPYQSGPPGDVYQPGPANDGYRDPRGGGPPPPYRDAPGGYGAPYQPPGQGGDYGDDEVRPGPPGAPPYGAPYADRGPPSTQGTYSENEVMDAGHRFFGGISKGLANAVEYVFQQSGRPNGYILGEDAGGAFIAGLRYGEGVLHTKDAGRHRVYWQGPSLGYDFGGEGSKTLVLVYNLRDPSEIYNRFGGIQGSAYVIGGVSVQFQKYGDVVLAPIRSGLGLRLGANVGYLKYTREPTWNPF